MSPLGLLRACHPLPALAVTVFGGLLAAGMGHTRGGVAAVIGTVALSQLSVGWGNDAIDAARDAAVGRTDKPLAGDPAGRRTVAAAAVLAAAATLAACLWWGWPAGAWFAVAVLSAHLYNWPLKATAWSIAPYLVSFACLVIFISTSLPGAPAPPGWLVAAAALLAGAAHLLNAVPDLADDAATGIRGLPQRLGARRSLATASGLLLAATLTLLAGARPPLWAGAGALLTAVALIVIGWYAAPRAAFRALLAVAAVDLALLVLSGAL